MVRPLELHLAKSVLAKGIPMARVKTRSGMIHHPEMITSYMSRYAMV